LGLGVADIGDITSRERAASGDPAGGADAKPTSLDFERVSRSAPLIK
jgi:hypothetical protein